MTRRAVIPLFAALPILAGCLTGPPRDGDRGGIEDRGDGAGTPAGARPWTGWDDLAEPAFEFRHPDDWIALEDGDERIPWSVARRPNPKADYAAELDLAASAGPVRLRFRPVTAIPIPDPFDTVELWVEWLPDDDASSRPVRVDAWLEFESGETLHLPWSVPESPGWHLLRHALPADWLSPERMPARFLGFDAEAGAGGRGRLFLSGFTPYARSFLPIDRHPPPFRRAGRVPGEEGRPGDRHAGRTRIPIPSSRLRGAPFDSDLPGKATIGDRIRAPFGPGPVRGEISIDPARPLDGVRIRLPDGRAAHWAGPRFAGTRAGYPGELVFLGETPSGFRLGYSDGLSLEGEIGVESLALTYSDPSGDISAAAWPAFSGRVPDVESRERGMFLRRLAPEPAGAGTRFLSLAWDPYVSRASTGPEAHAWRGVPESATRYVRPESGRRPGLRERFVLTLSGSVAGALPRAESFPPPVLSPGDLVYVAGPGPAPAADWHRYGIDGIQTILRLPGPVGPGAAHPPLERFPRCAGWSRDDTAREPDGAFRPGAAPGAVRMKPSAWFRTWRAEARDALLGGAAAGVLVPLPALAPGEWTDADGRMEGAGSFRDAMDSALAAWHGKQESPPPLILEEDAGWPLAPWASLLMLSSRQGTDLARAAERGEGFPTPDFFAGGRAKAGVGSFTDWLTAFPGESAEAVLNRYLALHLALGAAGRLPEPEWIEPSELARAAITLQTWNARAAGRPPCWMGLDRDGRLREFLEIWPDGGGRTRLYLQCGEMEIWIHFAQEGVWEVLVGKTVWRLPPSGWVAAGPGYLNVSALAGEGRIVYIETPEIRFYRGPNAEHEFMGFQAENAVLVRRGAAALYDSAIEVYDFSRSGRVRFPGEEWIGWLDPPWVCHVEPGAAPVPATWTMEGGEIRLQGPPGTFLYRLPAEPPGPGERGP